MIKLERLALGALVFILIGLPTLIFGYRYGWQPAREKVRTIDIVAATPEEGGFQPDRIEVGRGEKVRLRFHVPDVTHGVAIAGLGVDTGHIDPGQVKEVEVAFAEPGVVTFYCNTWCSPNHWRMRGTITVIDPANPDAHNQANRQPDPVVESLLARGINIDAPRQAEETPAARPDPAQGRVRVEQHRAELPAELFDPAWRREHSPAEAYGRLAAAAVGSTGAERWDMVAHLWTADLAEADRAWAESQYAKNCAACHGETGGGDGPAAAAINAQLEANPMAEMAHEVAKFVPSPQTMGASDDIYYAKLRRGGMGTSMPAFGPIFDEAETWRLVAYLRWLTFTQAEPQPIDQH